MKRYMGHNAPISKTRLKKDMAALQDLGAELVALSGEQLAAIDLPDFLRDAVVDARRITGFEARRRQMQYVGKLMRKVDAEPIRARLEAWKSPARSQVAQFKRIESWRERLIFEDGALAELLREHPHADAQHLHALIHDAQREREENRPPKSFRALFQSLRKLLAEGSEEGGERRQE
jgi:ribosome-associated protein